MDGWTASTTGSVRKGFEFGMDSSTASAAEVKGSGWAEEDKRRTRKKRRKRKTEQRDYGEEQGEKSLVKKGCMRDDMQGEKCH